MILKIIEYPDEILRTPTEDLTPEEIGSEEIKKLIRDMIDTCEAADGLGLTANQVGVSKSLFVYKTGHGKYNVAMNPEIIVSLGKMTSYGEGCLSIPGKYFTTKRAKQVKVRVIDQYGVERVIKTRGKKEAKMFQHEIDHLKGICLTDKGK